MNRKIASLCVLTVFLTFMFSTLLNVQRVEAAGTICIRADGSIDPPTAPITTVDNMTYVLTDNINDSIVVERDNIVIDGAGYTLQGAGAGAGVNLVGKSNVTAENMKITGFEYGIWLAYSSSNNIYGNNMTDNEYGIWFFESSSNNIYGNNITDNANAGIWFFESSNNNIYGNNMTMTGYFLDIKLCSSSNNNIYGNNIYSIKLYYSSGNRIHANKIARMNAYYSSSNYIYRNNIDYLECGEIFSNSIYENNVNGSIFFYGSYANYICGNNITDSSGIIILQAFSSNNTVYHNNFMNSTYPADSEFPNLWDNGYPSGGNYWSNYVCIDIKSGPHQDILGSDGIGDTPYIISENSIDRYPLVTHWKGGGDIAPPTVGVPTRNPPGNPEAQQEVRVSVNVADSISGVKNVTLFYTTSNWTASNNLPMTHNTSTGLYETIIPGQPAGTFVKFKILAYDSSENNATREEPELYFVYDVIPEFPSFLILPLFMIATLLAVKVYRRKQSQDSVSS